MIPGTGEGCPMGGRLKDGAMERGGGGYQLGRGEDWEQVSHNQGEAGKLSSEPKRKRCLMNIQGKKIT